MPSFSIHKDNYFITGVPTNKEITSNMANAKYQISFKQRITKNILPYDTYLFFAFGQKLFRTSIRNRSPFAR